MDHLLDFPEDSQGNYETAFPEHPDAIEPVPLLISSVRTTFEREDFDLLPDKHLDELLANGPRDILRLELSTSISEFLQSWLFFSLMAKVLQSRIFVRDFVRDDSKYVQTNGLRQKLHEWHKNIEIEKNNGNNIDVNTIESIDQALDEASSFISRWSDHIHEYNILPGVWLSLAILGETLTRARLRALPHDNGLGSTGGSERRWGTSQYLENAILNQGWCPSLSRMISSSFNSLSGLFIACHMKPPQHLVDGKFVPTTRRLHADCSPLKCEAHFVDESRFPLHCQSCTRESRNLKDSDAVKNCRSLGPDLHEIDTILSRGNIPLVCLHTEAFQDDTVQVFEYDRGAHTITSSTSTNHESAQFCSKNYVALSHVWSDGLGNHAENTLPQCRIVAIQKMVDRLYRGKQSGHIPFWLDTLCIPRSHDLRKRAIRMINQTFCYADKVLVLDEGLQQCGVHNGLEPLMRINMSKWVRRLWTLQEGSFCRDVYFRFGEGRTLSVKEIENRFQAADGNLHLSWIPCAQIFNPAIRSLKQPSTENQIAHIWQAVQWRVCQRPCDETLCLATLLDLDPGPLFDVPEEQEQRMCRFLSMLDETVGIPPGMIFLSGPKLSAPGFRWAPATWMTSLDRDYPYPLSLPEAPTFLTMNGLLLQRKGIRLLLRGIPKVRFWLAIQKPVQWYMVERAADESRFTHHEENDVWLRNFEHGSAYLILSDSLPATRPEIALLVSVVRERQSVKWAHALERVWITPVTSGLTINSLNRMLRRPGDCDVCLSSSIGEDQYWCVDGARLEVKRSESDSSPQVLVRNQQHETSTNTTTIDSASHRNFNRMTSKSQTPTPHGIQPTVMNVDLLETKTKRRKYADLESDEIYNTSHSHAIPGWDQSFGQP